MLLNVVSVELHLEIKDKTKLSTHTMYVLCTYMYILTSNLKFRKYSFDVNRINTYFSAFVIIADYYYQLLKIRDINYIYISSKFSDDFII